MRRNDGRRRFTDYCVSRDMHHYIALAIFSPVPRRPRFCYCHPYRIIRIAGSTARPSSYFRGSRRLLLSTLSRVHLGMSAYVENGRFCAFRKQVRTSIIAGIKLFHINTAPTLRAQGRSGQSTLSDDPALQAPARSTRERGQRVRGSSSSSHWWLLLVGLIAAVLCVPFIRTVLGWAMRVYC